MAFADWHWFAGGFVGGIGDPNYTARIHTLSPIVGEGSLEFHAYSINAAAPVKPNFFAYHQASILPTYKPRGVFRTLTRCLSASGGSAGDRLSVGLFGLSGARLQQNSGLAGSYALVLDTAMGSTTWERIMLAIFAGQWNPARLPEVILWQMPLSTIAITDVVALELAFWHWLLDDWGGVRLIGKMGAATDYSDLVQLFEYMNTDYPTLAQTTGFGLYPGIGCQFMGSVDVLFDETELEFILTDPFRSR